MTAGSPGPARASRKNTNTVANEAGGSHSGSDGGPGDSPAIGGADREVPNRALPGIYVDKILFGLPPGEARDYWEPYRACVSIAMSAQRRGWSEADFVNEVARDRSCLWLQLRTQCDGRLRSDVSAYRTVHKAWDTAEANLRGVGMRTPEDIRDDAVELAMLWADRLTDTVDGLSDAQAAVMGYVVSETERRRMLRVTCPGRDVAEFAKIPHRTAARILQMLSWKGLLIKHYSGRGGSSATGRAAIYQLADPGEAACSTS